MTNPPRRVLGIDPGLTATGYGVIDADASGARMIASGVLRTRSSEPRAMRLARIHDHVAMLLATHHATELAIEQQFVAENVRSAMAIGEARAAAMVAAARAGVPVFEFAPTAVKESVTGWGGAPKEQVLQMVMIHLGLTEAPHPMDISDALAIALTRVADARLEDALARA
jgi:crossover junction endodeoxyribonuclease RuvC